MALPGSALDGLAERRHGGIAVPHLVSNGAQQVQSRRKRPVGLQELPQVEFSVPQPPGLHMLRSQGEHFRIGGHRKFPLEKAISLPALACSPIGRIDFLLIQGRAQKGIDPFLQSAGVVVVAIDRPGQGHKAFPEILVAFAQTQLVFNVP